MNPVAMENVSKNHDKSHIVLSQIDTLRCQRKELEHKESP